MSNSNLTVACGSDFEVDLFLSVHEDRSSEFDKITSAPFQLKTADQQVAMNGVFKFAINFCNITYVTTTTEYDQLLIHVHNGYTSTRTIQQVQ